MSETSRAVVKMFHVPMTPENAAIVMRYDFEGETYLCITFSRVSGLSFLRECTEKDILPNGYNSESFEQLWDSLNFPHFHDEEETLLAGYAAVQLNEALDIYMKLIDANYLVSELFALFKETSYPFWLCPQFPLKNNSGSATVEMSALLLAPDAEVIEYYFDKGDALTIAKVSTSKSEQKRLRKVVAESALPDWSVESTRTITGITAELITFLLWMRYEFE